MNFPALRGNWVDLFIILLLSFYLLSGWSRGFLLGIADMIGFILSFIGALRLYSVFGELLVINFSLPRGIANAVGFLLVGIIVEIFFSILINFIIKKIYQGVTASSKKEKKLILFFRFDKFLGVIPAIFEALIFTAFIMTLFVAMPVAGAIKSDIVSSKIGGPLVSRTQKLERQLNLIFGQAVNETLNFLTINPTSGENLNLHFSQKEVRVDENAERVMFFLVNKEREKIGLGQLSYSQELTGLARDYARDMLSRGYFSHYNPEGESPFDRMEKRKINFLAAGENLALAPNVNLAHQGLMNSPGHRANILSKDFGKVGIGIIDGGIYGEMIVQEFTN